MQPKDLINIVPKLNFENIEYIKIKDIPNPFRSEFFGDIKKCEKPCVPCENEYCAFYTDWIEWLSERNTFMYMKKYDCFYGYVTDNMCEFLNKNK